MCTVSAYFIAVQTFVWKVLKKSNFDNLGKWSLNYNENDQCIYCTCIKYFCIDISYNSNAMLHVNFEFTWLVYIQN